MQDKSSYTSPNKPQISEGLKEYINVLFEVVLLKGESFDPMKKKYLKKYSEAQGLNYTQLEQDITDLIELLPEYLSTNSDAVKRVIEEKSKNCYVENDVLKKIVSTPKIQTVYN